MSAQLLENYLKETQQLSCQLDCEPGALQELLHKIETAKDQKGNDPILDEFFKAEYAFFNGCYENALKHYLEAKTISKFEFFCFRASAYISKSRGHLDKALTFIRKALEIYPEDYLSLVLLSELLKRLGQDQETEQVMSKIKEIVCQATSKIQSTPKSTCPAHRKTLGGKEAAELVCIFETSASEETLFSAESQVLPSSTFQGFLSEEQLKEASLNIPMEGKEHAIPIPSQVLKEDSKELEIAIDAFQQVHAHHLLEYHKRWKNRPVLSGECLYVLSGWPEGDLNLEMLTEKGRKSSSGCYVRWNHKGIVVNPTKDFFKNFHQCGLYIKDIDFVIVANDNSQGYPDLLELQELCAQSNRINQDAHMIHYYLHPKAFQHLSGILKTNIKSESPSVHSLELLTDSHEAEKIELCPEIRLHYFQASPALMANQPSQMVLNPLGIRLECRASSVEKVVNIGAISGVCWSPLLGHQLGVCDLLLVGLGNTCRADYTKSFYQDGELGFFGIDSLVEELKPKLVLCTEFGGREGDIRLELIRKLRIEQSKKKNSARKNTTLLPADVGLCIDLNAFKIKCSMTGNSVDLKEVRVIRSSGPFSRLHYLSSVSYL